jgi:hypothetical protein
MAWRQVPGRCWTALAGTWNIENDGGVEPLALQMECGELSIGNKGYCSEGEESNRILEEI